MKKELGIALVLTFLVLAIGVRALVLFPYPDGNIFMDYSFLYGSGDMLNASSANFSEGIIVGTGIPEVGGAFRFDTSTFEGYNGTSWVVLGTGGGVSDTDCNDGDGKCNLLVYFSNLTSDHTGYNKTNWDASFEYATNGTFVTTSTTTGWDKNEIDDFYINGTRNITGDVTFQEDVHIFDNKRTYQGNTKDFEMYWNGTCQIFNNTVSGTTLALC